MDPGFLSDCAWSSGPICNDRVLLKTPWGPQGGMGIGDRQVLSAGAPLPDGPHGRFSCGPLLPFVPHC